MYPLIGYVADAGCGRFKMVISSFSLVLFSYLEAFICLLSQLILGKYYHHPHVPQAITVISISASIVMFVSVGGYQANFIQLGLDQQLSAPSRDLALFVHWVMWAYNFGCTVIVTVSGLFNCAAINTTGKVVILAMPLILTFFSLVVLVVSCLKREWFNSELMQGDRQSA